MCNTGVDILPKEEDMEKTGRGGMGLLHFTINYDHWQFREETGADKGRDCTLEYIDGKEWANRSIQCQVKGSEAIDSYKLKKQPCFSYNLEKRTINYALRSSSPFVLFLCDLNDNIVYYLPVQDAFMENEDYYSRLAKDTDSMNLRIPMANIMTRESDEELVELTRATYSFINGRVVKTVSDK